jgi:hypothetical protein
VLPGLQGVQAAKSSWLNSARVKKQSLQEKEMTNHPVQFELNRQLGGTEAELNDCQLGTRPTKQAWR